MNESVPGMLGKLNPRPAPAELRLTVLGAVERALQPRKKPRWEKIFERAVAASILIAITAAIWRTRAEEQWQTRVYGSPPLASAIAEVTEAIASVTDEQTGRWFQERLSAAVSSHRDPMKSSGNEFQQLLDELHLQPAS